ncbi:MAG: hypothetical protein O3B01_08320 [Planctomycetota bacterium]|nr:hypothetical protein [Planctomycetota bacterium]MDA1138574.1 hypothetical protein [Planctomycetota bacterium]
MLVDEKQHQWAGISLAIFLVALVIYLPYEAGTGPGGPKGKTVHGLAFGIAGFTLMMICGLLGARKAVRTWRIGKAQSWLRAHIWLGLVSFPLILFHSGFSFGGGLLSQVLMYLFVVVLLSGVVGIIIQNVVPRILLERIPHETIYEQIPHVIDQLRREGDDLVEAICGKFERKDTSGSAGGLGWRAKEEKPKPVHAPIAGSEKLKEFYVDEVRPLLYPKVVGEAAAFKTHSSARFGRMRTLLSVELHEPLGDLEHLFAERRELDLQKKIHMYLHGWLFIHIPVAYALLALSIVHAVVSLYY